MESYIFEYTIEINHINTKQENIKFKKYFQSEFL